MGLCPLTCTVARININVTVPSLFLDPKQPSVFFLNCRPSLQISLPSYRPSDPFIMKLFTSLLLLLPAVLANPISDPSNEPPAVIDAAAPILAEGLVGRQSSCTVSGSGGLNVLFFPNSFFHKTSNICHKGAGTCRSTSSCLYVSVPGFCPGKPRFPSSKDRKTK